MFGTQKGGAAKTTSAVCTAYILNRMGHKTLYIDGDSQLNGSMMFKAKLFKKGKDGNPIPKPSIVDLVLNKRMDYEIPFNIIIQHCDGGDVIINDPTMDKTGRDSISSDIDNCPDSLKYKVFEDIRNLKEYEYVVIDTAPNKSSTLRELLAITDYIIFPVADAMCLEGAHVIYGIAKDVMKNTGRKINVAGFLMTIARPDEKSFKALYEDTVKTASLSTFDSHVFKSIIRRRADFSNQLRCLNIPIKTCPESDASKDYIFFVNELIRQIGDEANG